MRKAAPETFRGGLFPWSSKEQQNHPFISNSLHYSSETYPYVTEFRYLCPYINPDSRNIIKKYTAWKLSTM